MAAQTYQLGVWQVKINCHYSTYWMDASVGFSEEKWHETMSGNSIAQGLAESQEVTKGDPFADREDPARSWIDLGLAFKSGDPLKVREVLAIAKLTKWTHEDFSQAVTQAELWSDEDGSGPDEGWVDDFEED